MKKYLTQQFCQLFGCVLLAVSTMTGCQTADQADSGDMASVLISGHSEMEIQEAVAQTFLADGYQQADRLTFEKQGTEWEKLKYGGWSSNPVWIRMRVKITSPQAGQFVIGCDAFAVVDRGEATMEEEKKLSVSHQSECEKILQQTETLLNSAPKP